MRLTVNVAAVLTAGALFAVDLPPSQPVAQVTDMPRPAQVQVAEKAEKSEAKRPKKRYARVKSGDSLITIAKKHKTNYQRIYNANSKIKHPDLIYPGDKLRIPHKKERLKKRKIPQEFVQQVEAQPQAAAQSYAPPRKSSIKPIGSISGSVWDRLAACESGGNWSINTGNGFYGGLQFTLSSWQAVGGTGYPHQAGKSEQIARAEKLQAIQGWGAWPACSSKLGLI